MKIWIHAATEVNPESIRRAFARTWKEVGGDPDGFLQLLGVGYGNGELPRALLKLGNHQMFKLARKYIEYKQGNVDKLQFYPTFDMKGATEAVDRLTSELSDGAIEVSKYDRERPSFITETDREDNPLYREVLYQIRPVHGYDPEKKNYRIVRVIVYPDVPFTEDSELKEQISEAIDEIMQTLS